MAPLIWKKIPQKFGVRCHHDIIWCNLGGESTDLATQKHLNEFLRLETGTFMPLVKVHAWPGRSFMQFSLLVHSGEAFGIGYVLLSFVIIKQIE